MTRFSLIANIAGSLMRDRQLPLAQKLVKGLWYVQASICGLVYFRACNSVGARPRSLGRPHIRNRGRIVIGDDFNLNCRYGTTELATGRQGAISIGNRVHVNYGVAIVAQDRVHIGDRTHIGQYSVVSDTEMADPHHIDGIAPQPVSIGNDVWVAGRVTVLPGAIIGDGTVIAAGSVVSGSIPARVIAGGVPARIIRSIDPTTGLS